MNFNQLSIRISLDDLNEFAPKYFKIVKNSKEPVPIAVKFVLNKNNIIEAAIQYYTDKYPNINRSDNVFCTGYSLCGLEVVIGKSKNIDGREIPVGFENETVESIFNKKFVDQKSTGVLSRKSSVKCGGKPKEINMAVQTSNMDEYGEACEKYYGAVDEIKSLEEKIEKLNTNKPKSNFFGKQEKWFECLKKLSDKKELLEQNKVELEIEKGRVFFDFGFDPKAILAYAYRLAAMKKIQMVLKEFESYNENETKQKLPTNHIIEPLKPSYNRIAISTNLSPVVAALNNKSRQYGS